MREGGIADLECSILGRHSVDLGDGDQGNAVHLDSLCCSDRDIAECNRASTVQRNGDGRTHADQPVADVGHVEPSITEGRTLELVESTGRRNVDFDEVAGRVRDGAVCLQSTIDVCHPDDTSPRLAFVGGDGRYANADTPSGSIWTLPNLAKERRAVLIQAKFVHKGRGSHGSKVDVTSFQRVGPGAAKHGIGRNNSLQHVVCSPRAQFEAAEVVSIHDIRLPVLPNGDRYSADSVRSFEHTWVE